MSFKKKDIVIITNGRYLSKEGIILGQYKPYWIKSRWIILFPDNSTCVLDENNITLSTQYKRDNKLKSLGI